MRRIAGGLLAVGGLTLVGYSFWMLFVPEATYGFPGGAALAVMIMCLIGALIGSVVAVVGLKLWKSGPHYHV